MGGPVPTANARVAIVGAGAVGRALPAVLAFSGAITFIDRRERREDFARGQGWIVADASAPSDEMRAAVTAAQVVVLALPRRAADAAIPALAPSIAPGTLVVETTSIKSGIERWCDRLGHASLVGINPLFGPDLEWRGRPVIVVDNGDARATKRVAALLRGYGCCPIAMDADGHDRWLARRQGATHALLLALAQVLLSDNGAVPDDALIGPPPYQMLLLPLARMLAGNPEVYAEIQALNPYAHIVRREIAAAITALDAGLPELEARIGALARAFGAELAPAAARCEALFAEPIVSDSIR